MALHQRYNNENILSRAIIAGLLNILNNKITYEQVWNNEDIETIQVPWYYNMSGDERFMQDFYTNYAHCLPPKPVDGNFDMIPRGIIDYKGSIIDPARITSRYIQGNFLKEVNGQLQTYRSFLYSIPLNMNFECEMWLDTQITSLKVEQAIREVFYKTVTFYVYYKGMRVGSSVGFPEDLTLEKNIQYSFESDNKIKIKFALQVETYQPVFDPTTEVNANNYMTGIGYRIVDKTSPKHDGTIKMTDETELYEDTIFPKGYPLLLEWEYTNENAIINKVDILWSNTGENERNVIEKGVFNNEYYVWSIPESFTNYKHPSIIWPQDGSVIAYRSPSIKILPDICTGIICASSFHIIDGGYFLSPVSDASVNVILEMKNTNNQLVYSGDSSLYFVLSGNKLNEDETYISDTVKLPYGNIVFPGTIDFKSIDLYVVNSVATYGDSLVLTDNAEAFGVIRNITIV
jgi:hypothetical protein